MLVFLLGYGISRNIEAAGLIAASLVLGALYVWPIAVVITLAVGLLVVLLLITHRKIQFAQVNMLLLVLAGVITGVYGFQLVLFLAKAPRPADGSLIEPVIGTEMNGSDLGVKPDIYYIILDGYGRADVLERLYGYDNFPFIRSIQEMGFMIPEDSKANYAHTLLSLSSSLNMQYLDAMASAMGDASEWWPIRDSIHHSQVRQFLEQRGYRTVFIASNFDYTNIRDGDEYQKPYPVMLNDFESGFVRFTNLSVLESLNQFIAYPSYSTHRRIIQANFEVLPQVALTPGPKFVFTHIIATHPPFVFDENGNPINPDYPFTMADKLLQITDISTYKQRYIAQLQYINRELTEMIRAILANSDRPPVVILQADHGPGLIIDRESSTNTCLFERFPIFTAYYVPGADPDLIEDLHSPVNTFRLIFNAYFSTDLPILPDRSYFSSFSHFYTFQDVTDQIGSTCSMPSTP